MSASWPFSNVVDFTLDTGPGVAVPLVLTSITGADAHLVGAHFTNEHATDSIVVLVTNGAGFHLCRLEIPAGGEQPYEWPFRPAGVGVKWSASAAGIVGHLWGYIP